MPKYSFLNAKNFCVHRFHCQKTNVCNKVLSCGVKCRSCPSCNLYCKDFEKEQCTRLDKPPFVCNGCPKSPRRCTVAHKYRYNAKAADRRYRDLLSDCRSGINMTQKQLHDMDNLVSPLIGNGQSPYQIITNNPELGISVRTLYSYIERGILLAKNIHLKRKVKFKPRKTKKNRSLTAPSSSEELMLTFLSAIFLRILKWIPSTLPRVPARLFSHSSLQSANCFSISDEQEYNGGCQAGIQSPAATPRHS